MTKLLIDTSIFIDFARTSQGFYPELLSQAAEHRWQLLTSSIVIYEFWRGRSMSSLSARKRAEELFSSELTIISVTPTIAKKAGTLSREGWVLGADSLIAASAMEIDAQLVTLNLKDFQDVPELRIYSPVGV